MTKNRSNKKIDPNFTLIDIKPLTKNQEKVFNSKRHLVLHGSAGTGKTMVTSYLAYKDVLARKYSHLVYVRSVVPTRAMGFLPGNEAEKSQVYEQPYEEIAVELFGRGDAYSMLKHSGSVKFTTTSHIRGINFNDCVVIVDECQNMSYQELDSIITRVGKDCRIIFCGDYYQTDLKDTGIRKFYDVLKDMNEFDFINFTIDDVVRSNLVKSYLKTKYEKGNFEQPHLHDSRTRISQFVAKRTDVLDSDIQQSDPTDSYPELRPT